MSKSTTADTYDCIRWFESNCPSVDLVNVDNVTHLYTSMLLPDQALYVGDLE